MSDPRRNPDDSIDRDAGLQAIVDEVARILQLPAVEQAGAFRDVCEAHPEHSDQLRRIEQAAASFPEGVDRPASISRLLTSTEDGLPRRKEHERFGPYRLLRELGRGGQGVVWLAEDTRLQRRIALKVLHSGPASGSISDREIARFRREAETASKLDHPNICALLDAGEVDGVPFLAFRYVEGETLMSRIERTATSDPRTTSKEGVHRMVRTIEKVARALHNAHERGLIHRDIKPGNVMLTEEDEPVILDFGLAREELGDGLSLTQSGDLLGTPAYMSPEQLTAQRIPLDRRTDIYSLGATLYECLTTQRPFTGLTRAELYQQILTVEPLAASKLNHHVPRDLHLVLQTAMEKDRERRYQTALELAEDLRRYREFEPVRARPIGRVLRSKRWAQRNPALAVALVALSVGLIASLFALDRISRESEERRIHVVLAESEKVLRDDPVRALKLALEAVDSGLVVVPAISQLHRVMAYGMPWRSTGPGTFAEWSPDGENLIIQSFGSRTGPLRLVRPGRGIERPLFGGRSVEKFGFSSSGDYIFGVQEDRTIHVRSVARGRELAIPRATTDVEWVALPSRDHLLVRSEGGSLTILDLSMGSPVAVAKELLPACSNVAISPVDNSFAVGATVPTKSVLLVLNSPARPRLESPRLPESARRVAYHPKSELVAAILVTGEVVLWSIRTHEVVDLTSDSPAEDLEFSPDGGLLLTLHSDGGARLWTCAQPRAQPVICRRGDESVSPLVCWNPLGTRVTRRYFSPTSARFTTSYRDLRTCLWNRKGGLVQMVAGRPGFSENWVEWTPDGTKLLLMCGKGPTRMFDPDGRAIPSPLIGRASFVAVSPDGRRFFRNGYIWQIPDPAGPRVQAHGSTIRELAISGSKVVTGSDDPSVRLWHLPSLRAESTLKHTYDDGIVTGVDIDVERNVVVAISQGVDGSRIYFGSPDSPRNSFRVPGVFLKGVDLGPFGRRFATVGGGNNTCLVRVFDTAGTKLFDVEHGGGGSGSGVHLTRKYLLAATGRVKPGGTGTAALWTSDGQFIQEFRQEVGRWPHCADARMSRDESVVACAFGEDVWLYRQSSANGRATWPLEPDERLNGHTAQIWCVRFDRDGERLVTTSDDGTARVWTLDGKLLAVLRGHDGSVRSAAFTPDGKKIVTAGADGSLRMWFADSKELIAAAHARLRELTR